MYKRELGFAAVTGEDRQRHTTLHNTSQHSNSSQRNQAEVISEIKTVFNAQTDFNSITKQHAS
jgi:hypothetical protein